MHMGGKSDLRANCAVSKSPWHLSSQAPDNVRLNYCGYTTNCLRYSLNPPGPFQSSAVSKRRINVNQTTNRGNNDERRSTAIEQPLGLLDGRGNLSDSPRSLRHTRRLLMPLRRGVRRAEPFRTGPRAPFFVQGEAAVGRRLG